MPSPFPGMDPYLEGYLWPDVHHRLATQISDQLMPMLRPRYVARVVENRGQTTFWHIVQQSMVCLLLCLWFGVTPA